MKKFQKLDLVLKCLQIAYVSARVAEKLLVLWNMINNYQQPNDRKVVV